MEDIDELANGDSDDEFYFVCLGVRHAREPPFSFLKALC
jgi:hypothetical protein